MNVDSRLQYLHLEQPPPHTPGEMDVSLWRQTVSGAKQADKKQLGARSVQDC